MFARKESRGRDNFNEKLAMSILNSPNSFSSTKNARQIINRFPNGRKNSSTSMGRKGSYPMQSLEFQNYTNYMNQNKIFYNSGSMNDPSHQRMISFGSNKFGGQQHPGVTGPCVYPNLMGEVSNENGNVQSYEATMEDQSIANHISALPSLFQPSLNPSPAYKV